MNTLESRLLEFVRHDLLRDRAVPIHETTYLFDDGLVDSLKILQLIAFMEVETGRTIPDADIVMKNFRTVRAIAERFSAPMK
jgi:acyl carrier protein